jgi:hypothetical protein
MFYEDKETPGAEVRRIGDYQGVYTVDDDTLSLDVMNQGFLTPSSVPWGRTVSSSCWRRDFLGAPALGTTTSTMAPERQYARQLTPTQR